MPEPLSPKPPRLSEVHMTELVLPNDANPLGNMLGGRVLYLIDIAGSMAAIRHAGRVCVTASIERVDFLRPVRVGQALILHARPAWAGHTSIAVDVDVFSEDLATGTRSHTCSASLTFVALGPDGRPAPVPPVAPETDEERRRYEAAERRARERRAARGGA